MTMTSDVFPGSILDMPASPGAVEAVVGAAWSDLLLNRILVCVCAVVILLLFNRLAGLVPSLAESLSRWRGNENLEHSMSLRRTRNAAAVVMFFPLCLVFDRYVPPRPSFASSLSPEYSVLASILLPAAFLLLRWLFSLPSRPSGMSRENYMAARHTLFNYMIVLSAVATLTAFALNLAGAGDGATATVILAESAFFYLLSLIREGQIFAAHCSGFSTFLYLCRLEIIPAGMFAAGILLL